MVENGESGGKRLLRGIVDAFSQGPEPGTGDKGRARPLPEDRMQGGPDVFAASRGGGAGGGASRGPQTPEDEAKDVIRDMNSTEDKDRRSRVHKIKEQLPPKKDKDQAITELTQALQGKPPEMVAFVGDPATIKSAEVADFYNRVVSTDALQRDPRLLSEEALKLIYSTGNDASPEVRREVSQTVRKVRGRVDELLRADTAGTYKDLTLDKFDTMFYGKAFDKGVPLPPEAKKLYDPEKPEGEDIIDPLLIKEIRLIQDNLAINPSYKDDPRKLSQELDRLNSRSVENGVPLAQITAFQERMGELYKAAVEVDKQQRARESSRSGVVIFAKDLWDSGLITGKQTTFSTGEESIFLGGFDPSEVEDLLHGYQGMKKWFSEFITGIYGVGREQGKPDLPDENKFKEFEKFMRAVYGKDAETKIAPFRFAWGERGKQEYVFKALAFMPGELKDKVGVWRRLVGGDLDYYAHYSEYSSVTFKIYEDTLHSFQQRKQSNYNEALAFLTKKPIAAEHRYAWVPAGVKDYDHLYVELAKRNGQGLLTDAEKTFMMQLEQKADIVGYGTLLMDSDVLLYNELNIQYTEMKAMYEQIQHKQVAGIALTPEETAMMEGGKLEEGMKKKFQALTRMNERGDAPKADGVHDKEWSKLHSYSVLENEVHDNLVMYLKAQGMTDAQIAANEWQIKDAIWSSRMFMVDSLRMVDIGVREATRPVNIMLESFKYADRAGKYVMVSPFLEDVGRVINPEVFAHRFSIGGPMGARAWEMLRYGTYEDAMAAEGTKFMTKTKKWREEGQHISDPELKQMREIAEFMEQDMGISYSELMASNWSKGGGYFDGTNWRSAIAVLDNIRNEALASGKPPAYWENQALSLRYLLAKGPEKKAVLELMAKRSPDRFLQILAGESVNGVLEASHLGMKDLGNIQRALSLVGTRMIKEEGLLTRSIDLGSAADFNELIAPFLRKMEVPETQLEAYRTFIVGIQDKSRSYFDKWAKLDFALPLSMTDFDWDNTNFFQLGSTAMDRRGRDLMAMASGRDIINQIFSDPQLLCPKKPEDTLKKLLELRNAINTYADPNVAEKVTRKVFRVWMEFNRNRASRNVIGWIPGATSLLRLIGETPMDKVPLYSMIPGWKKMVNSNTKFGEFLRHLPHSASEAVSLATRFTGAESNAWDEFKMTAIIQEAQRMGLFTANENFYRELSEELKTTMGWRAVGVFRKYWWLVPTASVALAAGQAFEEEKKK
jgi:hypothetical protein